MLRTSKAAAALNIYCVEFKSQSSNCNIQVKLKYHLQLTLSYFMCKICIMCMLSFVRMLVNNLLKLLFKIKRDALRQILKRKLLSLEDLMTVTKLHPFV